MAGAGADARAARLQHLDGLLQMPRPEEFDQVLLGFAMGFPTRHTAMQSYVVRHPLQQLIENPCFKPLGRPFCTMFALG